MSGAGGERLHGLDHLRAAAVLMVMLLHYGIRYGLPSPLAVPGIGTFVWFGWSGVDLFFVLSGYLIGDRLLAEADRTGDIRLARFWLGRGLRILPAYLAVVAVYVAAEQMRDVKLLAPLWKLLTFTQNLLADPQDSAFVHAWSLGVEWHFYLLFPLALLLTRRWIPRWAGWALLAVAAAGFLARHVAWTELVAPLAGSERLDALFIHVYFPTYARLDGLLVGVGIAALFRYRPMLRERIAAHGDLMFAGGMLALFLCAFWYDGRLGLRTSMSWSLSVLGFSVVSVAYGLLVAAAVSRGSILHRWRSRLTATLAAWSFAIYLVHVMAYSATHAVLVPQFGLTELQALPASLVLAVLGGGLLHYTVERPFLALRDRILHRGDDTPE